MRSVEQVHLGEIPEHPTVSGVIQIEVCVSDMVRIGEATVQTSQPPIPCARLAERGAGSRNSASSHMRRRSRSWTSDWSLESW